MNDGPPTARGPLAHPLILGPLLDFLAGSHEILIGRLHEDGVVAQGNPALESRLGPSRLLVEALRPGCEGRWRDALGSVDRPGAHRVLSLEFGGARVEGASYRGVLYREDRDLWLLAERATDAGGSWMAEVLDMHVELARLNRALYLRTVELERANAEVEARARTDTLTGLANRWQGDCCLRTEVNLAQASALPLGCIMVDVDGFKAINDTYGHPVGDLALIETARVLAEGLRPRDHLARVGGEEFLILAPGADENGAGLLAERLRHALSSRVIDPIGRGLTACFGVAALRAGEAGEDLVRRADGALLRAKAAGRDRVEVEVDA